MGRKELNKLGEVERRLIAEAWPEFQDCIRREVGSLPGNWRRVREQFFDVAVDSLIRAARSFRPESANPLARRPWSAWWRLKVRFALIAHRRKCAARKYKLHQWSILSEDDVHDSPIDEAIRRAITDPHPGHESACEHREYVESLLSRLHRHARDLIRAVYLDGTTQAEIAARRGVNQGYISHLMREARAQLRNLAESDGILGPG